MGATKDYADNWSKAFGGKKAKATSKKVTAKVKKKAVKKKVATKKKTSK